MNPKSLIGMILPFILMFAVFYFLLILPEKKRKKKYDSMIEELKVNDKIVTRGGIIGRIIKIKDDSVIIESSQDRTKLEFSKQGISSKID
ncbi:preprotein translocase subunit YajC [Clostridium sp.]|uniref:preprotein translocase subunit YajC n=1 Tax=Clostridium sp. TaxID=1506 RepID=UPI0026236A75|nr:preprotein translocase subunit YajC [Clostridium sp.]